jgi:hypothetical protein
MDKPLALAIAFFILFSILAGCTIPAGAPGYGNNSSNQGLGGNDSGSPNPSDIVHVGNISRRAPPPLPE